MMEENKILLLGPGESGKSTIFKQMKILGAGGFSKSDLEKYKPIVYNNCISQIQVLLSAMELLQIPFDNPENNSIAEKISQLPPMPESWSPDVGRDIDSLWKDSGIQKAYAQRDKEFQLNDSASYFLSQVERFIDAGYTPKIGDVLRARVRTTGIEEAKFSIEDFEFKMMDVGGQRSERRKWIHCFDCVSAILFCGSLIEYDQTLREDDSVNRMKESLKLFEETRNSPWFKATPMILFLNKLDLFGEKIKRVSLNVLFDDYKGAQTEKDGCDFIKKKYLERDIEGTAKIHVHFTIAVNTENINVVFEVVRTELVGKIMDEVFTGI